GDEEGAILGKTELTELAGDWEGVCHLPGCHIPDLDGASQVMVQPGREHVVAVGGVVLVAQGVVDEGHLYQRLAVGGEIPREGRVAAAEVGPHSTRGHIPDLRAVLAPGADLCGSHQAAIPRERLPTVDAGEVAVLPRRHVPDKHAEGVG